MNKNYLFHVTLILTFIILISCSHQQVKEVQKVRITDVRIPEYGIFTKENIGVKSYKGINTKGEPIKIKFNEIKNWKLEKETTVIPRSRLISFGLSYVVRGTPEGEKVPITIKLIYPQGDIHSFKKNHIIGQKYFLGYSFNNKFNYLIGKYSYQFYYDQIRLAEKQFTVYK